VVINSPPFLVCVFSNPAYNDVGENPFSHCRDH